jgi:hypothetical protein
MDIPSRNRNIRGRTKPRSCVNHRVVKPTQRRDKSSRSSNAPLLSDVAAPRRHLARPRPTSSASRSRPSTTTSRSKQLREETNLYCPARSSQRSQAELRDKRCIHLHLDVLTAIMSPSRDWQEFVTPASQQDGQSVFQNHRGGEGCGKVPNACIFSFQSIGQLMSYGSSRKPSA